MAAGPIDRGEDLLVKEDDIFKGFPDEAFAFS
jgi:hypothetical protein